MADLSGEVFPSSPEWSDCASRFLRGSPAVRVVLSATSHGILKPSTAPPQPAPLLAQSASGLCLWARRLQQLSSLGRHSFVRSHPGTSETRVGFSFLSCLTSRSTRTPPALPSALSLHSAFSASPIVSVQAGPVSFFR